MIDIFRFCQTSHLPSHPSFVFLMRVYVTASALLSLQASGLRLIAGWHVSVVRRWCCPPFSSVFHPVSAVAFIRTFSFHGGLSDD